MVDLKDMSLIDIIQNTPDLEDIEETKETLVPEREYESPVESPPKPQTPIEIDFSDTEDIPEFYTPAPDPSWSWEAVKQHEDQIQNNAFSLLKKILARQGIPFVERDPEKEPYTLEIGELIVQNILLPSKSDPRVVTFKGIRIVPPEYMNKRVAAFRRKRKEGPFNFRGLVDRIKLYLREIQERAEEKEERERKKLEMQAAMKHELQDMIVPPSVKLKRNEDGSYSVSLEADSLSLEDVKTLSALVGGKSE